MSKTKTFSSFIYINWKDEDMRMRKTKQNSPSPYEVVTKVSIDVEIPDFDIPEISKTIEVPEVEIKEAVSEMVEFEELTQDMPEPRKVLLHEKEYIVENFNDLEEDLEGDVGEEFVNWIRELLAYEYKNNARSEVIHYLEDKLHEYRGELA